MYSRFTAILPLFLSHTLTSVLTGGVHYKQNVTALYMNTLQECICCEGIILADSEEEFLFEREGILFCMLSVGLYIDQEGGIYQLSKSHVEYTCLSDRAFYRLWETLRCYFY